MPLSEQGRVAAKLVDDEADDHRRVVGRERDLRSEKSGRRRRRGRCRRSSATGQFAGAREAHIGDVAVAQVDLGRAARAFDQHEIGVCAHARVAVEHGAHQLGFQRLIFARPRIADDFALDDDLRADLALRLEQHRVHVDAGHDAAGARLQAPARGRSRRRRP